MSRRDYIKTLTAGTRFQMIDNTVYVATRVRSHHGMTTVDYTVEGSHYRGETTFVRASLTTVEILPTKS
jgi:hypothetical protein